MPVNKNDEMLPVYNKLRKEYDDGLFTIVEGVPIWLKGANSGKRRGRINIPKDGYKRYQIGVNMNGKRYQVMVHRLVYFIEHGVLPDGVIMHLDDNPSNNRMDNLKSGSNAQNLRHCGPQSNSTSLFKGVGVNSGRGKKWKVTCNGKHGGYYNDRAEAAQKYDQMAYEEWGRDCYFNFPQLI